MENGVKSISSCNTQVKMHGFVITHIFHELPEAPHVCLHGPLIQQTVMHPPELTSEVALPEMPPLQDLADSTPSGDGGLGTGLFFLDLEEGQSPPTSGQSAPPHP